MGRKRDIRLAETMIMVSHGEAPLGAGPPDLRWREFAALAPLVVFVVWIGLQPEYFLRRMQSTLNPVADAMTRPIEQRWGESSSSVAGSTADLPAADRPAVNRSTADQLGSR